MIRELIEKLKKREWTFSLIGTDNLDVESMASSMHIDATLRFKQNEEETRRMFCQERRARFKFNKALGEERAINASSFFDLKEDDEDPLKF